MKNLIIFIFIFLCTSVYGQDLSLVQKNTAWAWDEGELKGLAVIIPIGEALGGGFGSRIDYDVYYKGRESKITLVNPSFYINTNSEYGITPDRYVIIKFKEKKNNRIYTRYSSGASGLYDDREYSIPLKYEKIEGDIYKFSPTTNLEKGEYGICYIFNCFPTFVYDFNIK